jgi:hypothetical protein
MDYKSPLDHLADFDIYLTDESGLTRRLKRRGKRKAMRSAPPKPQPEPPKTWTLTIDDLIVRTGKSRRWIFMHADRLPFVRRITRKTILGDAKLEKWLEGELRR